jgi:hypothetical protein
VLVGWGSWATTGMSWDGREVGWSRLRRGAKEGRVGKRKRFEIAFQFSNSVLDSNLF